MKVFPRADRTTATITPDSRPVTAVLLGPIDGHVSGGVELMERYPLLGVFHFLLIQSRRAMHIGDDAGPCWNVIPVSPHLGDVYRVTANEVPMKGLSARHNSRVGRNHL